MAKEKEKGLEGKLGPVKEEGKEISEFMKYIKEGNYAVAMHYLNNLQIKDKKSLYLGLVFGIDTELRNKSLYGVESPLKDMMTYCMNKSGYFNNPADLVAKYTDSVSSPKGYASKQ